MLDSELMRLTNQIVLATLNPNKCLEFQALFQPLSELQLVPLHHYARNAEKLKFVEKHDTFLANATAKARLVQQAIHQPTLADDSGLEVTALQGRPGVFSHRFAKPIQGQSQEEANCAALLNQLEKITQRSAQFTATVVLALDGLLFHATGTLQGTIAYQCSTKEHGFGYDSLFIPDGSTKTLAEIPLEEKNKISHRALALQALMQQIKDHGVCFSKS